MFLESIVVAKFPEITCSPFSSNPEIISGLCMYLVGEQEKNNSDAKKISV